VNAKTRVYLIDDHPLVRESLTNLIHQQPDLEVCGEAGTAREALNGLAAAKADVAVVDLSLEDRSGLQLIKDLKLAQPDLAVLVLSMHEENLYAERALRAGARGYIMKREATKKVVLAIRSVREGKLYLSDRLAATLAEKFVAGTPAEPVTPETSLSDRELEVFRLMGRGYATRQIADALNVSAKTVQAFQARIKTKLNLSNATELLHHAIRWEEGQHRG
jgi:DNA-binding NarL/FixJ family response regulator